MLDAAEETRKKAFRRSAFKVIVLPYLKNALKDSNKDEISQEIEHAWRDFEAGMEIQSAVSFELLRFFAQHLDGQLDRL